MFDGNLDNIYRDIYILTSKYHFDPKYVESITPAERGLFVIYAREEQEQAERGSKPKEDMVLGTPIDPMHNPLKPVANPAN